MQNWFCGLYFKNQSNTQTFAVIPAIHHTKKDKSCSIQLITDHASWNVRFPYRDYQKIGSGFTIGNNRFTPHGLQLELQEPGVSVIGSLRFGSFQRLRYDIMGPFCCIPFMECRHSVYSMRHTVNGSLQINGEPYVFRNAVGYLEGDRGRSFPKHYAWTQCSFSDGALMLSVADVPLGKTQFTGIIGAVFLHGREYRIATYLGARAMKIQNGELLIQQGSIRLQVRRLEKNGRPLCAPTYGAMTRTIHEQPACRVYYRLERAGRVILELEAPRASMEYEYPY